MKAADVKIGGWLPRAGRHSALAGSVLVGRPGPGGLEYAGQVGSGFAERELRQITAALREMEQDSSPFATPVPADVARRARWSYPALTAEVGYVEVTRFGRFRHPVWRGLRPAVNRREGPAVSGPEHGPAKRLTKQMWDCRCQRQPHNL